MKIYGKIASFLVCTCLGFSTILFAQGNVPAFTWNKTATGFYWPTGIPDTQYASTCGTWLGRDVNNGGCYAPTGVYHIGMDILAAEGSPVYAIASGTVRAISPGGWNNDDTTQNIALFIVHTRSDGSQFLALYGHIHSSLKVGDVVTGGVQIGTIGNWIGGDHLHFGIHPGVNMPVVVNSSINANIKGYGREGNNYWPDTNGFVDPIAWIKTQPPACANGSSEMYSPNGQLPIHPDGTIVKVKTSPQIYVLKGAQRLAIPDRTRLNQLYGFGRGFDFRDVITISQAELNQYHDGGIVWNPLPDNGKNEPNGRIIRQWSGSEFAIVTKYDGQNGVKIPFSTGSHFFNLGYAECNIAGVSDYSSYTTPVNTTMETMNRGFTISGFGDPSYSISAVASPSSPSINQAVTITALAANNIGTANDKIVDIEIRNSSGTLLQQSFFEGQYFTVGATATEYPITWTPSATGTYKVSVAIFSANWGSLENWNDNALTLTVGGTPSGYTIDLWWPTDGSTVSGVQPFKSLLQGFDVSQYTMYWQVDGGQLNLMSNDFTDWPHKQSDVDLSGWTWRGTGPYNVNFVAKDLNGNVLAQRSVNITVTQ